MIMMKSKVHAGPVQQLQFDATKVVEKGDPEQIAGARRTSTRRLLPAVASASFSVSCLCLSAEVLSRPHYLLTQNKGQGRPDQ